MPPEMELVSSKNIVIVQMPDIVRFAGHFLFIFGSTTVAVFHLNALIYEPTGYSQIGYIDLVSETRQTEPTFKITHVCTISCGTINQNTAQIHFLVGGSHAS